MAGLEKASPKLSSLAPFAGTLMFAAAAPTLAQDKDYDKEMAKLDAEIAADEAKAEAKAKAERLSTGDILSAAPADHWIPIPINDLMILTLPNDATGKSRQAIIQLLPAEYSGGHVRNVRKLAKARWWNGTKIYRVAKGFVTQFGGNADNKPLPKGLEKVPEREYFNAALGAKRNADMAALKTAVEYSNEHQKTKIKPLMKIIYEGYGAKVGFGGGWPIGSKTVEGETKYFPITCRGSLSPAHYASPDTGSGAEISVVTGEAARNLDMSFGFVGRVIDGLEHLVNLPLGTGASGFYASKSQHVTIKSMHFMSELPAADQPRYEYLASTSPALLQYLDAQSDYGTICAASPSIRKVSN